jgi:hypothetical protein
MKNKSLLIASVFAASSVFAQDLTSKKGEPILPEAGDWAISFDATPFLNYFGNMFNGTAGNAVPTAGYTNGYPWAIKGKMFKDEKTAYRAGLRLGFGSTNQTAEIAQKQASTVTAADYPTEPPMVEDTWKSGYNGIAITGGLEMRRGKTRLQGYYGGELIFGMRGTKDVFTYGNALTSGDPATVDPNIGVDASTTTDFGPNMDPLIIDWQGNAARITESKMSMMTFGLRGFIGAEYFVAAKISIGAEYGWGLGFSSMKTSSSYEAQGTAGSTGFDAVGTFTDESKTSGFSIDSDIQNMATGLTGGSGSLNITFHF